MKLSLIIPVYNRPDEVEELLESLTRQRERNFEVILVEDGSQTPCDVVAERFKDRLELSYYAIPNGGPGHARNYGAKQSKGDYLIVLDSDCILPPGYIQAVNRELEETNADAFGGPDRASDSFTDVQKVDSAWIDTKTKFLLGRDNYSYQLKNFLAGKRQEQNRTCLVMYGLTKKEAEKKYLKMKKLYTEKSRGMFDVRYINEADFKFMPIDMSYEVGETVTTVPTNQ